MSPPISSAIKERVIELHREGKGRNEIAEILTRSHIRISQGSVTNILRGKRGNSTPSQPHPETRPQKVSPSGQSQEHFLVPECAKDPEGPDEVNLVNSICTQDSGMEKEITHVEVQENQVQSSEVQE